MNRKTFNQYIAEGDFRTLFVSEMGWNNPPAAQSDFSIELDGQTFSFSEVAERNGFQILTCSLATVPTASLCKKLDIRLRRQANDYICIFVLRGSRHHLWAVPVRKVEKRDIVIVEYEQPSQAEFLFGKIDGLCFDLDEKTTIVDVVERVQAAFIVNSEKLTKDFYSGFHKEHTAFAKFITGIEGYQAERDRQWYTSVMLNRLMFCYFIQKKGFLDSDTDYLQHRLHQHRETQNRGNGTFFKSFYRGFLTTLFHGGLNSPEHSDDFRSRYGRIPYLNGGMFDEHQIERDYADLDIADDAFESLFNFFDRWQWHLDDRITATGRDINPDVLGYIFEQYINDRAQMGAYYTKEDITEYIGRNTIVPYLIEQTLAVSDKHAKPLWDFLRQSGDKYIFDAVKRGVERPLPDYIEQGIDTAKPNLLERRSRWNERTTEEYALPTEIWRETVERRQRYADIKGRIERGELTSPNDFVTYNLDIRQFIYDYLLYTDDHLFVKHFYAALQQITILDPTCGSGAFLFAALNILEPLYEVCIGRMQDFRDKNPKLFKDELAEVEGKYRSNIQYFIYKSIILRNLYGVDIMVEATEVAKLRLFLKMVAVVDVDLRHPNLGLDPLPDIDFNIRCGNTLVGYATEKELKRDLTEDLTASMQRTKIETEMDIVARTFSRFKESQLQASEDLAAFKSAKRSLTDRLHNLNDTLNRLLHSSTAEKLTFDEWLSTHQPFHWLAEFYEIIHDHGGFDVIIGNPPYVEYPSVNVKYTFDNLLSKECGNLYGNCIERSMNISNQTGKFSFIVPVAITCSKRMKSVLMTLSNKSETIWYSNYDDRPGKLFEKLQHLRASIIILSKRNIEKCTVYTTKYNRWYTENRDTLFQLINYNDTTAFVEPYIVPKFSYALENSINTKIANSKTCVGLCTGNDVGNNVYYRSAGGGYFLLIKNSKSTTTINGNTEDVKAEKKICLNQNTGNNEIGALLSSTLFYWRYIAYSDCRNLQKSYIDAFQMPHSIIKDNILQEKGMSLFLDYEKHKKTKSTHYNTTGNDVIYDEYYPKLSKPIIDEIDKVLAKHYGFTEEELDFIINYDIKYRMGDDLGSDE